MTTLPTPDTYAFYKGQPCLTRHAFQSKAAPAQTLIEIYRHGPLGHYIGFVDSSKVKLL